MHTFKIQYLFTDTSTKQLVQKQTVHLHLELFGGDKTPKINWL